MDEWCVKIMKVKLKEKLDEARVSLNFNGAVQASCLMCWKDGSFEDQPLHFDDDDESKDRCFENITKHCKSDPDIVAVGYIVNSYSADLANGETHWIGEVKDHPECRDMLYMLIYTKASILIKSVLCIPHGDGTYGFSDMGWRMLVPGRDSAGGWFKNPLK